VRLLLEVQFSILINPNYLTTHFAQAAVHLRLFKAAALTGAAGHRRELNCVNHY
jgi:hypothetical protein